MAGNPDVAFVWRRVFFKPLSDDEVGKDSMTCQEMDVSSVRFVYDITVPNTFLHEAVPV